MVIILSISFYKFLFAVSKLLENLEYSQSRTFTVFLPCSMVRTHHSSLSCSVFALSHSAGPEQPEPASWGTTMIIFSEPM